MQSLHSVTLKEWLALLSTSDEAIFTPQLWRMLHKLCWIVQRLSKSSLKSCMGAEHSIVHP